MAHYVFKIPIQFQFRETQRELQYVDYMDVAQSLGGFNSFFAGIWQLLAPFACLAFHRQLAAILREEAGKQQREHTLEYLRAAERSLKGKDDEESKSYHGQVTSMIRKLEILNSWPLFSRIQNLVVAAKFEKSQIP